LIVGERIEFGLQRFIGSAKRFILLALRIEYYSQLRQSTPTCPPKPQLVLRGADAEKQNADE
jgi:hypothetical protein